MANINKIKLSGTTYNIQDLNATKTVELTQAEYDGLSPKDPNVFYIITDAQGADLSNYYTKSETSGATEISTALASKADTATTYTKTETDNAITAATSTKQDTLVSGTNIKTINGETLLGEGNITIQGGSSGGKAIEAGRGISITTGETADTVSFSLPISAGTGTNSIIEGVGTFASGNYSHAEGGATSAKGIASHSEGMNAIAKGVASHAEGSETYANGIYSHAEGNGTITNNVSEHASGQYNNSVSASTTFGDSGNTLFSVGNGTADNARHNVFEIRQNGDIYISKDGQDIKLQDTITATAANTTALGGLKLVKLTKSEYDSLTTKDNSTLYVIVN